MEKNKINGAAGNAGIGKIKYRLEEKASAKKRHPIRPMEKRELEHIHNFTKQERAVIKAVDDISDSTGSNEHKPDKNAHRHYRSLRALLCATVEKLPNPAQEDSHKGNPE